MGPFALELFLDVNCLGYVLSILVCCFFLTFIAYRPIGTFQEFLRTC